MKKRTCLGMGIIALLVFGALLILPILTTNEGEALHFGSILILSGGGSAWGQAARNGMDLAVEDLNARGGVLGKQLTILYEDDGANPVNTITAFKKLTEVQDIDFIIGPSWTKQGLAIKNLIDDEVVISPSLGGAEFNENNKYIFNSRQHDYILSQNLAEYVYQKGHRNVAVVSVNDPYNKEQSDEFKKVFEDLGGRVEFIFDPVIGQKDLRSDLLKIKHHKRIDALVATTGGTDLTSLFAIQMKEVGLEQPVYSVTIDQTRIDGSKGATDGWEYLSSFTPSEAFAQRYLENYGTPVHIGADSAYDAVMMLSQAIEGTQSTSPEVIQKYLNKLETFSGVSGHLFADGQGGFTKNYRAMRIENGMPIEIR